MVHIEDIQSNVNNFVVTELSHDPVIKNIFDMIEKNIADTDHSAITVATLGDSIGESCAERIKQNQESVPENVAPCICDIETYDNMNNPTIPSCMTDEQQSLAKRNNLKLSLKCSGKVRNDEKCQPISPKFGEKDNQESGKSFVMLPKRDAKFTSISSSDSTETTSPVTPFATTSISFQYPDPRRQKAAYDALVSRGTQNMMSESQYENQEDIATNSITTDTNSFETKLGDLKTTGTFQTMNSEKSDTKTFEGKIEFTTSNGSKKSVKQLAEMLDSKKLQFRRLNVLSKLHPTVTTRSDSETTEAKASSDVSDPEISKPSLIGVNILGLNDGKSIAEIIASKKNHSFHKHPLTSPKPFLKKTLTIPKSNTSDEEEQQKWLNPSLSSSTQTVHPSEKTIAVSDQRENTIVVKEKKPILQDMQNSRMLPTIIKVDDSECSTNFQQAATNVPTSLTLTTTGDTGKDSSDQCSPQIQRTAKNHIYENLNQSGNQKYLETSFDGPIAMTVVRGSKNDAVKNFVYIRNNDNVTSERKVKMINPFHVYDKIRIVHFNHKNLIIIILIIYKHFRSYQTF